jgi:two-component system, LytTR family, response regulator LytT
VIRAVVVEDEPLARQYLCTLLEETGKVEVVGEADNGRAGLRLCAERAPDAAFLDIRIPGPDGLSLAGRLLTLARPPLVVFVAGFSGHAVDAFRVEAVDYLLKPIEFGAVLETVRRLEHRLDGRGAVSAESATDAFGDRLVVKDAREGGVKLLPRGDIVAALRRRRRTWIHTATKEFPTYYTLATLARWLGGSPFLQISRDAIVNMTVVTEITRVGDRRYELRLPDRARTVAEASRTGAALLADYLRYGRPG